MTVKKTPSKSAKNRLRALADEIPDDRVLRANLLAVNDLDGHFNDHAIVVMGAAIADKALEIAILSQLVILTGDERGALFDPRARGTLSDLSSKIRVGYAMGIFGHRTRDDLETIRTVRNAFAHSLQIMTFEDDAVSELCGSLHLPTTTTILTAYTAADTAKRRYIETVLVLADRVKSTTLNPPRPRNALAEVSRDPSLWMRWRLLP